METFEESEEIHRQLIETYTSFGYTIIDVPFGTVEDRTEHIIKRIELF